MARILFDYECLECSKIFEELIHMGNPEAVNCPQCSSSSTKRMLSAPRIDPKLGLDPIGFPTMGDRWAKKHRLKPSAK